MRIALATDWYLPRLGGIELQLADLCSALRTEGHAATVITGTRGAGTQDVQRLPVARMPITGVAISASLRALVRDALSASGADVVHAHVSVVSPVAYAAILAARDLGLPTVVTFHSELHATARLLAFADYLFGWRRWPVAVTAVSRLVARQLEQAMPGLQVQVLANGVRRADWRSRADRLAPGAPVRFVTALRLHRKKRPRALLDAFTYARSRAPDGQLQLMLHGDGPQRATLERTIHERELDDCVTLTGWTSRADLAESYVTADAFVLPTLREAFGIAALEARCAGLPVVAMRRSGVTDFLAHGHNALLASDDRELGEHVTRLAVDPDLRARLAGAADDLGAFDWPNVVRRHLACYERAIDSAASFTRVGDAPS